MQFTLQVNNMDISVIHVCLGAGMDYEFYYLFETPVAYTGFTLAGYSP